MIKLNAIAYKPSVIFFIYKAASMFKHYILKYVVVQWFTPK